MATKKDGKKIKHSSTKVDAFDPKVRVPSEKGSRQNVLRQLLYTRGFEHIKEAHKQGFYCEVVTICDSMITDRIDSYVQHLLKGEDKTFVASSLFNALKNLGSVTKERQERDEDFEVINKLVETWVPKRNNAVHNYVTVRYQSLEHNVEYRQQQLKEASEEGLDLVRRVDAYVKKRMKRDILDKTLISRPLKIYSDQTVCKEGAEGIIHLDELEKKKSKH